MFKRPDIICAIEIGTSKICVLIGSCQEDGELSIIGFGEVPSEGVVVKGEIVDMDLGLEKLTAALEMADQSSHNELNNVTLTYICVTGCNINSYQASAPVYIDDADGQIDLEHIEKAKMVMDQKTVMGQQEQINISDSYYLLDGRRRVQNPIGQSARQLELFSHIVHGDSARLENFRRLYLDAGFEVLPELVFSGIADLYGVVSLEEREKGVLLIDLGQGTTEYIAICNGAIFASGVVPVGFDHVANDLSLGLGLPIESCRQILIDGTLQQEKVLSSGIVTVEVANDSERLEERRIPLVSFENIIDFRLRELFAIVKSNFQDPKLLQNLACGGVLTGGGANFAKSSEIFNTTFEIPVRIGSPYDHEHDLDFLKDPSYSTIWGALRYTEEALLNMQANRRGSITDALSYFGDSVWRAISNIKNSVKI